MHSHATTKHLIRMRLLPDILQILQLLVTRSFTVPGQQRQAPFRRKPGLGY